MVNICLRNVCQLYTQKTEQQGWGEVISHSHRAPQTPHHLSCSDLGRAQNTGSTESVPLRITAVPEPEQLRPGRCMQPRAGLGWFPSEQPRAWTVWAGRAHAPWAGAGPVWLRHFEHMPVLFVSSIPPSPQRNWTSEPKKCPPPPTLCQSGNQTLKRPAKRKS